VAWRRISKGIEIARFFPVKAPSGCETVYGNNPVVIENIEGPNIITENVSHENGYLADGTRTASYTKQN